MTSLAGVGTGQNQELGMQPQSVTQVAGTNYCTITTPSQSALQQEAGI